MAREKFQTLTEQMFYILLALKNECCCMDIMSKVLELTGGRVKIGPGTLYNLLEQFKNVKLIEEVSSEGRRKNYVITSKGIEALKEEYLRLQEQISDYEAFFCSTDR